MSLRISVVIPTLNETAELPATIEHAQRVPEISEIIVVDAGSADETKVLARSMNCRVLDSPRGRGTQLRAGAATARNELLMFLHADTWLEPTAGRAIETVMSDPNAVGGGCYKIFREASWLMRGSRFKCALRFYLFHRFMGDQAIFVRRDALEKIGGVPDVPLMEEFELCRLLRQRGRLALAPTVVSTSARRFHENGALRTYARMWWVTLLYYFGISPDELKRIYDKR